MRKIMFFALFFAAVIAQPAFADAPFHIGVVTGTVSQGEDGLRAAELMIEKYGDEKSGGMIRHITYPDNFVSEEETTISQIAALADDKKMKAIVVSQAVVGTAEAFRRVKEKRPDIICLAGETHEDPNVIASAADLVVVGDFVSQGYRIAHNAKVLGCKTFVHVSFPRHMSFETLGRRRAVIEESCKALGIKFVYKSAPDPTSDVGVAGAQQYILEAVPKWVREYGKDTAFFSTNKSQAEPMIRQVAKYGGYWVEGGSPLEGYPGAFGIDLKKEAGNWSAILKKIEKSVAAAGAKGRLGTASYSYGYTGVAGLTEHARRVVMGRSKVASIKDVASAFMAYTPGAKWSMEYFRDLAAYPKKKNMILAYQDVYVFGRGFMKAADLKVPERFYKVTKNKD
ncbi:MAG: DUF3798 domain-containing protein [Synergistes sp.]|nr:DUF3798 domain-containing protein [Synergistes sp.]